MDTVSPIAVKAENYRTSGSFLVNNAFVHEKRQSGELVQAQGALNKDVRSMDEKEKESLVAIDSCKPNKTSMELQLEKEEDTFDLLRKVISNLALDKATVDELKFKCTYKYYQLELTKKYLQDQLKLLEEIRNIDKNTPSAILCGSLPKPVKVKSKAASAATKPGRLSKKNSKVVSGHDAATTTPDEKKSFVQVVNKEIKETSVKSSTTNENLAVSSSKTTKKAGKTSKINSKRAHDKSSKKPSKK